MTDHRFKPFNYRRSKPYTFAGNRACIYILYTYVSGVYIHVYELRAVRLGRVVTSRIASP
jgi:ABC-type arginine transport system permease subunit